MLAKVWRQLRFQTVIGDAETQELAPIIHHLQKIDLARLICVIDTRNVWSALGMMSFWKSFMRSCWLAACTYRSLTS